MHFKEITLRLSGTLVLMFTCLTFAGSQERSDSTPVTIMFYNAENAFDIYDDPFTEDEEFLPDGSRHWNKTRYNNKLNSIYKTISAAGGWEPPAVIAFCEIENRKVLEDLIYSTPLSMYDYGIIHEDSPDSRGIDVCMIYRKEIVKIESYRSIIPSGIRKEEFHSRTILYVRCSILNDTVNLVINHWPSRRGGVLSAESLRKSFASTVKVLSDSICKNSSGIHKTIILGDFNCTPDDPLMLIIAGKSDPSGCRHINLAERLSAKQVGTYRYLDTWEIPDQVIVSEDLIGCRHGISAGTGSFEIFDPDFLLMDDPKYPGRTTFSTYKGMRYMGGYSDHLPVLLRLYLR